MGKNKLKKFREMESLERVFQFPFGALKAQGSEGFPLKGRWGEQVFGNSNPVVLELGCGKGEYTVGLAERFPEKNFIGIDIKGARMWTGACQVRDRDLRNAAFLRTNIELLGEFFAPGEVAEIWITFADPQMKKRRKRLTATNFLQMYRSIMKPDGVVNLKTDSPFLYTYTLWLLEKNGVQPLFDTDDLYGAGSRLPLPEGLRDIRTYYEQQWLSRGMTIKYLAFPIPQGELSEPEAEPAPDPYRAYPRHTVVAAPEPQNQSPISL